MQPQVVNTIRQKNPNEWPSAKEPMTGRQRWFIEELSRKLGEEFKGELTKAEASQAIDRLRAKAGQAKD